jgi:hypothetical protein
VCAAAAAVAVLVLCSFKPFGAPGISEQIHYINTTNTYICARAYARTVQSVFAGAWRLCVPLHRMFAIALSKVHLCACAKSLCSCCS